MLIAAGKYSLESCEQRGVAERLEKTLDGSIPEQLLAYVLVPLRRDEDDGNIVPAQL